MTRDQTTQSEQQVAEESTAYDLHDTLGQTSQFKAITNDRPKVLIISGSPRKRTCTTLIHLIEEGLLEARDETGTPLAEIHEFFLAEKTINPCLACGICSQTGTCVFLSKPEAYAKVANDKDRFKADDYPELIRLMEECDVLILVSPLYFAGPPAQLKALFDRCQPYWARRYVLKQEPLPKRRALLFFVGEGGDPHGFDPLVITAKSALQVAGFTVDKVNNYVGFRSPHQAPHVPPDEIYDKMGEGQRYRLKKAIEAQADFEQRAVNAGRALTRQLINEKTNAAMLAALSPQMTQDLDETAIAALVSLNEEPENAPVDSTATTVFEDEKDRQEEVTDTISQAPEGDVETPEDVAEKDLTDRSSEK